MGRGGLFGGGRERIRLDCPKEGRDGDQKGRGKGVIVGLVGGSRLRGMLFEEETQEKSSVL